jgi:NAD(P)-dependent dehydrogenase (short-subunit alcohol dehydrogenase family)
MDNANRVVVVTGASRGIGAGLVVGYRRLGFGVIATSRSIAPSKDEQVLAIAGDIRDRATAQKVVAAAKERFGRVDTLVNNAGIFVAKAPGTVKTPMHALATHDFLAKIHPVGRMGEVQDIVDAVL